MLTQFALALVLAASSAAEKPPACATQIAAPAQGDPLARQAAQRGLEYPSKSAGQWPQQPNCYGCQVQASAPTADDAWLGPMRRAEGFLASASTHWKPADQTYLQDINYALLGMVAAGAGSGEASALRLQRLLLERQNRDGGWGLAAGAS